MRVLITGAQGFIGRYTVAGWLYADPDVEIVGVGRSTRSDDRFTHDVTWNARTLPAPLPDDLRAVGADPRYQYVSCDLLDTPELTALIQQVRPDVVIYQMPGSVVLRPLLDHFAALAPHEIEDHLAAFADYAAHAFERLAAIGALLTPLPERGSPRLVDARRQMNAVRYIDRALDQIEELRLQRAPSSR